MAQSSKPIESQLHLMVTPESIRQAKQLADERRCSMSKLFENLVELETRETIIKANRGP